MHVCDIFITWTSFINFHYLDFFYQYPAKLYKPFIQSGGSEQKMLPVGVKRFTEYQGGVTWHTNCVYLISTAC